MTRRSPVITKFNKNYSTKNPAEKRGFRASSIDPRTNVQHRSRANRLMRELIQAHLAQRREPKQWYRRAHGRSGARVSKELISQSPDLRL